MSWKLKKIKGTKYLVENEKGEQRVLNKHTEGIKRGDYLQPHGKEKGDFLDRYGYLPGEGSKYTDKYLMKKLGHREFERRCKNQYNDYERDKLK